MVKLSSEDTSLLVDLLEAETPTQQTEILERASSKSVKEIGRALIDDQSVPRDQDVADAVTAIRDWVEETRRVTKDRFAHYA